MLRRAIFPLAILLFLMLPFLAGAQGGEHRAGLVIRYADGKLEKRCVSFSEASLTGQQLLERSGLQVIANPGGSFGGAVCSIDKVGCDFPAKDCFCQCMGTQCDYWAYYHLVGSGPDMSWQYSQLGAGAYQVQDGAVDGWSWGAGDFTKGTEPPKFTLADVCSGAASQAPAGRPSPRPANVTQYAAFGGAVLLLAGVAVVVLRRRG